MKKKSLLFITLYTLFIIVSPLKASAHVLISEDNMGAVIHIDPDDDPVANSQSTINISLKDKNSHFTFKKCSCKVSILLNSQNIYTLDLPRTDSAVSFIYTFPKIGTYTLNISGTPDDDDAFPEFSLNEEIKVTRSASPTITQTKPQTTPSNLIYYIIAPVVLIALLLAFILSRKKST